MLLVFVFHANHWMLIPTRSASFYRYSGDQKSESTSENASILHSFSNFNTTMFMSNSIIDNKKVQSFFVNLYKVESFEICTRTSEFLNVLELA